jgi:hypothetical protein
MAMVPSVWRRIMDPLVDEYVRNKYKHEIDGEVMRNSVTETRKFIIKLTISTLGMLVVSLIF